MTLENLVIGLALLFALFVIGVIVLRVISRKCPNCGHYTTIRDGHGYRCSNGHCGTFFTDKGKRD